MPARKPNGKRQLTKWEKKRISRQHARAVQGKKPLVEPLRIAPREERDAAVRQGRMVFYDGKRQIVLPLVIQEPMGSRTLQGIYRVPGTNRIVCLRANGIGEGVEMLTVALLGRKRNGINSEERSLWGFFSAIEDLGHMQISEELKGHCLGLKGASKSERHQRALSSGKHDFISEPQFHTIFQKLGYHFSEGTGWPDLEKQGKHQPLNNLGKWHRIEAINPRNGKTRVFTFPIKLPNRQ